MFDDFGFVTLVIAIAAFIFARKARNEVKVLRARLDAYEAKPRIATTTAAIISDLTATTPDIASASAVPETSAEIISETAPSIQPDVPAQTAPEPVAPAEAPVARPGFEERIGTRWVVWVGGLTLALGGFFMVRYSIEAGLLGPEVRVLLGGLFALALLAVGEFARRKESLSDRATAYRQYPGDPHRCRDRRRFCHGLCGLCAV